MKSIQNKELSRLRNANASKIAEIEHLRRSNASLKGHLGKAKREIADLREDTLKG
jgi:hypothetical protein